MKLRILAILLVAPLWACASQPSNGGGSASSQGPSPLGLLATPVYFGFKLIDCAASVPSLVPGAVASAVVPFKDTKPQDNGWGYYTHGVKDACEPPYMATPASG